MPLDCKFYIQYLIDLAAEHLGHNCNLYDEAVGPVNSKAPRETGCRRPCAESLAKRIQENDPLQVGSDHGVSGLKAFPFLRAR